MKRPRPPIFLGSLTCHYRGVVVGREGVVEMGYGGDVPRITCHGTREKGADVVNEVGNDDFHKFLWQPGSLGWTCGGQLLDFNSVSVPRLVSAPDLISKECNHWSSANATQSLTGAVIKKTA